MWLWRPEPSTSRLLIEILPRRMGPMIHWKEDETTWGLGSHCGTKGCTSWEATTCFPIDICFSLIRLHTYLQLSHDVCVCGLSHSKCFASRNKYVMNSYKLPDLICSFFSINDTLLVSWCYLWWFTVANRYDRDELLHQVLHRECSKPLWQTINPFSPYFFYLLFAMHFSNQATPRLALTRADSRFFKIPWWLRVWMHLPGKKRYGSSTGVNTYWTNHGIGDFGGSREKIVGALKFFILSDLTVKGLLNIYSPNSQNLKQYYVSFFHSLFRRRKQKTHMKRHFLWKKNVGPNCWACEQMRCLQIWS